MRVNTAISSGRLTTLYTLLSIVDDESLFIRLHI